MEDGLSPPFSFCLSSSCQTLLLGVRRACRWSVTQLLILDGGKVVAALGLGLGLSRELIELK